MAAPQIEWNGSEKRIASVDSITLRSPVGIATQALSVRLFPTPRPADSST